MVRCACKHFKIFTPSVIGDPILTTQSKYPRNWQREIIFYKQSSAVRFQVCFKYFCARDVSTVLTHIFLEFSKQPLLIYCTSTNSGSFRTSSAIGFHTFATCIDIPKRLPKPRSKVEARAARI